MKRNGKVVARKTPRKTPMVVPAHGNGLLQVGNPGNVGGGRPPSVIRERCRGSFERRIPVLEQIADGEASERIEVPLLLVLKHAHCPKCSDKLRATNADDAPFITVTGKVSPKAKDRTQAVDILGKYGLTAGRVDQEEVRARLARSVQKITELADPKTAETLLAALDRIWDPSQGEPAA
jgi:hypothetical protein